MQLRGRAQISSDEREASSKLATSMLFFLPIGAVAALLITLLGLSLGLEETKVLLVVVTVVAFFGVGTYTDRIHDRNATDIKELAYQICVDPERGANWAKRQLVIAAGIGLGLVFAVAALGRAFIVFGTDSPFIVI